jgi:hypothetical protein
MAIRNTAIGVGIPDSPFLTLEEGARFCRFDATAANPVDAFRKWPIGTPCRLCGVVACYWWSGTYSRRYCAVIEGESGCSQTLIRPLLRAACGADGESHI